MIKLFHHRYLAGNIPFEVVHPKDITYYDSYNHQGINTIVTWPYVSINTEHCLSFDIVSVGFGYDGPLAMDIQRFVCIICTIICVFYCNSRYTMELQQLGQLLYNIVIRQPH